MRTTPASDGRSAAVEGVPMVSAAPAITAAGRYVHWGVIQISVTNLLIIVAMVVVFALALVVPFPHGRNEEDSDDRD
jgi:hypothetical protein